MSRVDRAAVVVDARAADVFAAFRDHYIAWLPPAGMTGRVLAWDFRVGGRYAVELRYDDDTAGKSGDHVDVARGEFVVVAPDHVAQTAVFDAADPQLRGTMRIDWRFVDADDGAHVDVAASDVPAGISADDHAAGLRSTLVNLKRFVESRR